MPNASVTIRAAQPEDVGAIVSLVRELAAYEREPDAMVASETDFTTALFPEGGGPAVHAFVAVRAGKVIAVAVWFLSFSTWTGHHGIWLEDLYVQPEHRGTGIGKALLSELAALCVTRGYARFEWQVLDWNQPAIDFYRGLSATALDNWTTWRVEGPGLAELAAAKPQSEGAP